MRHKLLYLTIVVLGAIVLAGCNSADSKAGGEPQKTAQKGTPETAHADGARRITVSELQEMTKKGQAFVVDVRNQSSFDAGHIPGSKLIPSSDILQHLDELPKNKTIVTYCS